MRVSRTSTGASRFWLQAAQGDATFALDSHTPLLQPHLHLSVGRSRLICTSTKVTLAGPRGNKLRITGASPSVELPLIDELPKG